MSQQPPQDPIFRTGPGVPPPPARRRPSAGRVILAVFFTASVLACLYVFVISKI